MPNGGPDAPHGLASPRILVPGAVISAAIPGRIGPLVRNANNVLFALSVEHLHTSSRHRISQLVFDADQRIVGTSSGVGDHHTLVDLDECLSLISIDPSRRVSNRYGDLGLIEDVADPSEVFGREVRILDIEGKIRSGRVSSNGTTVEFRHPITGGWRKFFDVIRIRPSGPGQVFSSSRDLGAPVVLNSGALLGLVLCGRGEFTFVAPAHTFLKAHKLRLEPDNSDRWTMVQTNTNLGNQGLMGQYAARIAELRNESFDSDFDIAMEDDDDTRSKLVAKFADN